MPTFSFMLIVRSDSPSAGHLPDAFFGYVCATYHLIPPTPPPLTLSGSYVCRSLFVFDAQQSSRQVLISILPIEYSLIILFNYRLLLY